MGGFTHLHLHTQYSLLDGAIRVKDLFKKTAELGMDTVAVTDHGNMFGAIDLYTEAKAAGTKLIFGCETYVAATDRHDRTNRRNYHLILLAKNDVGYKNLSYLNSMGYLEGFYYNPRIDKQHPPRAHRWPDRHERVSRRRDRADAREERRRRGRGSRRRSTRRCSRPAISISS